MVWGSIPIQAQNWIQQMACIRSGRCMVVFKILLIIFTASDLVSESLSPICQLSYVDTVGIRIYFDDIRIRSCTAHEVMPTATLKKMAAIRVICLNWESPNVVPNILTRSRVPIA